MQPIVITCDGSALGNGKSNARAAWGLVVSSECGDDVLWGGWSGPVPDDEKQTNNRAEYWAALKAFEAADELDPERSRPLTIRTDSFPLVQSMTEWMAGWIARDWHTREGKPVQNRDLLEKLRAYEGQRPTSWVHVFGHKDDVANIIADRLARGAARSRETTREMVHRDGTTPDKQGSKRKRSASNAAPRTNTAVAEAAVSVPAVKVVVL